MRRISTSIAFVLSALLLVFICSAQEAADNRNTKSAQNASPIGINGPAIGGVGTVNYIPIWRTPNYLQSSVIYQASGGNIGIGTKKPVATLDVNGSINTAKTYQIGGTSVLSIGSSADGNLFLGVGAGFSNVAGSGKSNTFSGYQAGYSNTTGYGNTFSGPDAGLYNTTGYENTFVGSAAGVYNNGNANTFSGAAAGIYNITGVGNTFSGWRAGFFNTTGSSNTFSGAAAGVTNNGDNNTFSGGGAGYNNTTGSYNTFSGSSAGLYNTTGNGNTFYGYVAGYFNTTGNNDVYIANLGPASGSESNAIRIGGDIGLGYGSQTAAYIAGIYGATASGGVPVYVNSSGQLGTLASSLRFKEQVRDMGDSTNALMKLRPVTFLYKPEYDNGERTLQYGLIAEEVAKVYPELVAYDNDGQPYSVRYQYITTMLLNEVQKQYRRAETQAELIKAQQQEIENLRQQLQVQNATLQERLARLEGLVRAQVQTVAQERE